MIASALGLMFLGGSFIMTLRGRLATKKVAKILEEALKDPVLERALWGQLTGVERLRIAEIETLVARTEDGPEREALRRESRDTLRAAALRYVEAG